MPLLVIFPQSASQLLQFRVLRLGLFQDGDVRIGVFPEGEEVLIGRLGFGAVARNSAGSAELESGQRPQADSTANQLAIRLGS